MNIQELLTRSGGLAAIARELGLNEAQAGQGAQALLPALMGGFKKQAQGGGGVAGLGALLGQLGGGGLLDDVLAASPTPVARGDAVLGQVFGSKDVSRAVAQQAASSTGLDAGVLRRMLPMLAMLVSGLMARQGDAEAAPASGGSGGLGGLVGGLLGSMGSLGGGPGGGSGSKASGLAGLLDLDGDGNALDDIAGLVGRAMR